MSHNYTSGTIRKVIHSTLTDRRVRWLSQRPLRAEVRGGPVWQPGGVGDVEVTRCSWHQAAVRHLLNIVGFPSTHTPPKPTTIW